MKNHEVDLKEVVEFILDYCNFTDVKKELIKHIILKTPSFIKAFDLAIRHTTHNSTLPQLFIQAQSKYEYYKGFTFGEACNPKDFITINSLVKSGDLDNIKLAFYLLYNIIHEKHTQ